MQTYAYDIETAKNFLGIVFKNVFDPKEKYIFEVSEFKDELLKLYAFINREDICIIGYNNYKYDNNILKFILMYIDQILNNNHKNKLIFDLSDILINYDYMEYTDKVKNIIWYNPKFRSIDVMKMLALDKIKKSLKQTAIQVKHPKILDIVFDYTKPICKEQIPDIFYYCENDVDIVIRIFYAYDVMSDCTVKDLINLRYRIQKAEGINILSSSRSQIADKLLVKDYSDATGLTYKEYKDLRTYNTKIKLDDIIDDKISYKTDMMNKFLTSLKTKVVNTTKDIKFSVIIGNTKYNIGSGGLHSADKPKEFESTDEYTLRDADVTSFYPRILLNLEVYPPHLGYIILSLFERYVNDRVTAKAAGDIDRADLLKIVINSIFGKLGFQYGFLYYLKGLLQVTVNGQLYLLGLIEDFELNGITCISANTDGVLCKVPKDKEDIYYAICKKWESKYNFQLEFADYIKYCRLTCNSYIAIYNKKNKKTGEVKKVSKKKDTFLTIPELTKGFDKPIVSIALEQYYLNDIPIEQTIRNHTSIYDFCMSQKVDSSFQSEYHYINKEGVKVVDKLQKTLRYYAATKGGIIYKKKKEGAKTKVISLLANKTVQLALDVDESLPITEYSIDYNYYINQTNKLINSMKNNGQISLFDDSEFNNFSELNNDEESLENDVDFMYLKLN